MISKQHNTYALEFFGKAVILLSSTDQITWTEVGLADMGGPDFREMMKDFHAVVGNHGLRKAKVALFLPLEDVVLRQISGDDPGQILATEAGVAASEICFTTGTPDETQHYDALFAYRETLQEAADFAAQFGFSTLYFSARTSVNGFPTQPQIYLNKKPIITTPLALWSSVAMAAVLAVGAFSLWYSTSSTLPASEPETQITATAPASVITVSEPAKIIMAAVKTPALPIATPAFDTHDVEITTHGLDAQTSLFDFAFTPTALFSQPKAAFTEHAVASLPAFDPQVAKPLMLDALSASATLPALVSTTDNIATPTQMAPDLTDAAIPEDAEIPRPTRRGSIVPVETAVAVEPVIPVVVAANPVTSTPRPPRRPAGLRNDAATTQAAIAQDLVEQAIKQDVAAVTTLAAASPRAIGTNKRPPLKTSNFRAIVKRATALPRTTTTTTVAVSKPTTSDNPDTEKSTRAATTFSKGALSLVGVFGAPSKRSALFRTSTGGYRSVKIGQRVAGWKVVSISESSAKVTKGSRTKTMHLP